MPPPFGITKVKILSTAGSALEKQTWKAQRLLG